MHSNATKKEASRVPQFFVFGLKGCPDPQNNQPSTSSRTAPLTASEPSLVCKVVATSQALSKKQLPKSCQKVQTKFHWKKTPITKRPILTTCGQVSTCNLIDVPQCMKHHSNHPPLSHIKAATDPEVQTADIIYWEGGIGRTQDCEATCFGKEIGLNPPTTKTHVLTNTKAPIEWPHSSLKSSLQTWCEGVFFHASSRLSCEPHLDSASLTWPRHPQRHSPHKTGELAPTCA